MLYALTPLVFVFFTPYIHKVRVIILYALVKLTHRNDALNRAPSNSPESPLLPILNH